MIETLVWKKCVSLKKGEKGRSLKYKTDSSINPIVGINLALSKNNNIQVSAVVLRWLSVLKA